MHRIASNQNCLENKFLMDSKTLTRVFWNEGLRFMNCNASGSILTGERRFRSFFGTSAKVCAALWILIIEKPSGSHPKHLLWCLMFMKTYNTEHLNASIAAVDEKTFRYWMWRFVHLLARLQVVKQFYLTVKSLFQYILVNF